MNEGPACIGWHTLHAETCLNHLQNRKLKFFFQVSDRMVKDEIANSNFVSGCVCSWNDQVENLNVCNIPGRPWQRWAQISRPSRRAGNSLEVIIKMYEYLWDSMEACVQAFPVLCAGRERRSWFAGPPGNLKTLKTNPEHVVWVLCAGTVYFLTVLEVRWDITYMAHYFRLYYMYTKYSTNA